MRWWIRTSIWKWLLASNLKKEVEGFVMACQGQAITTNSMKVNVFHQPGSAKCWLCGSHNETVDHLLTSCHVIAQSCYKKRHDAVAQIVHWELAKRGGFDIVENRWDHHPMSVMQNSSMKLLWDFTI